MLAEKLEEFRSKLLDKSRRNRLLNFKPKGNRSVHVFGQTAGELYQWLVNDKNGDLRIRKAATIYGPMSLDDFDRLLTSGKVTFDDQVSVGGGDWMTLGDFLTASAPSPSARSSDVPVAIADERDSSFACQRCRCYT